jgi:hypothetical protein
MTINTPNSDNDTATHRSLNASEIEQITLYLYIRDRGSLTGDLCRMTSKERCTWICSNHWSIEADLKQSKSMIDIAGGVYNNNEVKVKVKVNTTPRPAKQFNDILARLSMSQWSTGGFMNCLDGTD